jgi:hypothetical protein
MSSHEVACSAGERPTCDRRRGRPLTCRPPDGASGSALVLVILGLLLLSILGLSLVLLSMVETLSAANERAAAMAFYAAEASLNRMMPMLARQPVWDDLLSGRLAAQWTDGEPPGGRSLPGGITVDIERTVNQANCGAPVACAESAMRAVTDERPWGVNNPHWRLVGYGDPVADAGTSGGSVTYGVVVAGDDPSEVDGDPDRDGIPGTPGSGVILLRAYGFGPNGAARVVEAVVVRSDVPSTAGWAPLRVASWREVH